MKFTVPQFIEHESKIVGPLTFKQFIYIGSAGVIGFILFHSVPTAIFWPMAIILGLTSFALAFAKINGKPLPSVIANFFSFLLSSRLYLWQKERAKGKKKIKIEVFKKELSSFKEKLGQESQLKKIEYKVNTRP